MRQKGLILTLLFMMVIIGCTIGPPQPDLQVGEEGGGPEVVQKKDRIVLTGIVYPVKEVIVTSPLSGRVERINVKLDDYIKEGKVLLYLDPTQLKADLLAARARLARARSDLEFARRTVGRDRREAVGRSEARIRAREAEIVFENIRQRLERTKEAYRDGAVSKEELEGVENEYARAEADLKVALLRTRGLPEEERTIGSYQAEVMASEAELSRAEDGLRKATIKAPISGFIANIPAYPGQNIFGGWELVKIVDINYVIVEAKISPGLLRFVRPEQEVDVTINTVPPTTLKAKIDSIIRLADPKDQMSRIRILLLNKDLTFQPGFTAKVEIPIRKEK